MKLALAVICKGDDKEAKLLDRCLKNLSPFVDGIFVTRTQPNKSVGAVAKKYGAHLSDFEWCDDFAKARNFNFSQVPKDYDYIMWTDVDDMWRGMEKLRDTLEQHATQDAFAFWYLYDFDENRSPTVVHKKTMIVRNDGCVTWKGELHEDFDENRSMAVMFVNGIERMHFTTVDRVLRAKERNVRISQKDHESNPNDPRTLWNLGNSYLGNDQVEEAIVAFTQFIQRTGSDEEKYLSLMRLGVLYSKVGDDRKAQEYLWMAIGLRPNHPDAYHQLGYIHFEKNRLDEAERYLLLGLVLRPQYHKVIVYNPREYDYNPMMALAKVYARKSRPDLALPMLEGCLKIAPENKSLIKVVKEIREGKELLEKAAQFVKDHENDDDETLLSALASLDPEIQSHPAVCMLRNSRFIKNTTSGKEIVYYCGLTWFEWNPVLFKERGFGGSEEAVINLSRQWAKLGYDVTVYNNCGPDPVTEDGVTYKPFWMFNPKDKVDNLIIWRHPKLLDYDLNASKIFVDLHDVIKDGEFTEKRLAKIDRVFVKTQFHRSLFPNIPDDKIVVLPNGHDVSMFTNEKRDQYLMVNTSSPDRSLDVLPELFRRVKERVPQARLEWAYGWHNFERDNSDNRELMEWKESTLKAMEEAGITNLGRLSQAECAKLYCRANVLAYPSEFAEIDCISVKKAQMGGALPVTSDFGAFPESNKYGKMVKSTKTKDTWVKPYQFSFGIESEEAKQAWVDSVVEILQTPVQDRTDMQNWAKGFAWENIASKWVLHL
jgi:glycosyltransferase involved in cell wall biosynthesis